MAHTKRARAILHAAQLFDQQAIIGLVHGQRRTGHRRMHQRESRRKHSRRALERVHFQAGIVREEQARAVAAVVERLDSGVLFEGAAVFHAGRDLFEAGQQLDLHRRQSRSQRNSRSFPGFPVAHCSRIKSAPPSSEFR
jgi:hypothetical protein